MRSKSSEPGEHVLVLVVDDEKCVRDVTRTVLTSAGFTVIEASDGALAIATFTERHAEIRAVLLDLILPKVGGEEVLAHIRAENPTLPVIVSSGFDLTDLGDPLTQDTRTHFLKKPYGPNELLVAVRGVLGAASTPPA